MLVETVKRSTADDPSPMDVDTMGTRSTVPTLDLGTHALSRAELLMHTFIPQNTLALPTRWDQA